MFPINLIHMSYLMIINYLFLLKAQKLYPNLIYLIIFYLSLDMEIINSS